MDFLEDLLDRGGRNRQNRGGFFQNEEHRDDDHSELRQLWFNIA
jgi:hypothetical protein